MFEAILDKKLNADRGFIKPKRKPPEEVERLKRENFERAAPGLENPDEVKQMLGLADGGIATPKRGLVDEPGSYAGRRAIPEVTDGVELAKPKDGKKFQLKTKNKTYLFKTEKQLVDFFNKNIKRGSGAQRTTLDEFISENKKGKDFKKFFKDKKIYSRYYDGPLNASSIDKIWLNLTSAQKRQVELLFDTKGKNIKEAAELAKKGYISVTDLADKLGRSNAQELVQSMKNSEKFKKLFPNYLNGMITASNNSKWIKTTPSTLKKLKEWADDPLTAGLRKGTIKNVQTAFKDKKLMDYWKNWKPGTPVDQKLIDSVHGKKGSAYTMMQLGRTLQGKEPIEGVRKNVALGNKIIDAVRYKAKEFGDWHTAAYKYAKQDMDTFLPPGKSGTTFGDYQRLITKSLRDVGLEGFQVDEINALRSGVRGGTQPYSVFSQVLEGKYNQGLKRRFDAENAKNQMKLNKALSMKDNETIKFRPKGASNALTMGKQDYIKYIFKLQNDQIDNFFKKVPELKGKIFLPKFDLRDPKTVYGTRFNTFDPAIQNAILKNFKEVGYTVDVGKKALTQKELLKTITPEIKNVKNFASSKGFTLNSFAGALDLSQANINIPPSVKQSLNKIITAGKTLGKGAIVLDPLFAAMDYSKAMGEGVSGTEAAKYTGKKFLQDIYNLPKTLEDVAYLATDKGTLENFGQKENRLFSYEPATFAEDSLTRYMEATSPELMEARKANIAYGQSMPTFIDDMELPKSKEELDAEKELFFQERGTSVSDLFEEEKKPEPFVLNLMGGGIVGIRKPSAIPPEKGPQPQGLDYLRYYGT